jgi:hypothetical protein
MTVERIAIGDRDGGPDPKATAVVFAREGARALAADVNLDGALETKRIIEGEGGICEAAFGDVSLAADVATIVGDSLEAGRRIRTLGPPVEESILSRLPRKRRKSGSQRTPCWREQDSNPRSPVSRRTVFDTIPLTASVRFGAVAESWD